MGFALFQIGMLPGMPDKIVFEQDNITIGDLYELLSGQYGEQILRDVLDKEGKPSEDALIVINGRIIRPAQVMETVIPPGSEMMISALIAGG